MMSEKSISIPLNKGKLTLLLLASLAFVAACAWILINHKSAFYKACAVVGLLFFGYAAVSFVARLRDKGPGFVIDEEGIIDHSSAIAVGRVRWDEIQAISVVLIGSQRLIVIHVFEPKKFIEQESSLNRNLNATNLKLTGSPINISPNTLRINFDELYQLLSNEFELYKQRTNLVS